MKPINWVFLVMMSMLVVSLDGTLSWAQRLTPVDNDATRAMLADDGPIIRVITGQHRRLMLTTPIQRIAVANPKVVAAQLVTSREVLLAGNDIGRTSIMIWLKSGEVREYLCAVQRDLSVLEQALREVHSAIRVTMAPDRNAIVLTGTVPDITYSQAAEAVARNYLDARSRRRVIAGSPFVKDANAQGQASSATKPSSGSPDTGQPQGSDDSAELADADGGDTVRVPAEVETNGAIINLLQLETLPPMPEERIKDAIKKIGGETVQVRRVLRGSVRNDRKDLFLLEGKVRTQVELVRIIEVASHVITGRTARRKDVKVIADEAGALTGRRNIGNQQSNMSGGFAGGFNAGNLGRVLGGAGGGSRGLSNLVQKNLGRAKVIEAAKGRLLSFITVTDVPQIRVNISIYEINRNKLRTFNSDFAILGGSQGQSSLSPAQSAANDVIQGSEAVRVKDAFQNVLSFLNGTLANQAQLQTGSIALNAVMSLLKRLSVARSLSSPTLTVLSGERASFQVGGEVPIPRAFSPSFGGGSAGVAGVFSTVAFVPFGITLQVRPLVGENDSITLDVLPQVTSPDPGLTSSLRETTGTDPLSTAFRTRSFRTSAKLQDGQALLMAGLLTRDRSDDQTSSPVLEDVPIINWLFKQFSRRDDTQELVVVVNPIIVREPVSEVALWAFPELTNYNPVTFEATPPVVGGVFQ